MFIDAPRTNTQKYGMADRPDRLILVHAWCLVLASMLFMPEARGLSFLSFDARSISLGGTGVVSGRPGNSALLNPALMYSDNTALQDTWFSHSYIGARLIDRDGFVNGVRDFEQKANSEGFTEAFDAAKQSLDEGTLTQAQMEEISIKADTFLDDLTGLSKRPLRVSASMGASVGYSGSKYSFGVYARRFAVLGSELHVAETDKRSLEQLELFSSAVADLLDISELESLIDNIDVESIEVLVRDSIDQGVLVPELEAYEELPGVIELVEAVRQRQPEIERLLEFIDIDALQADLVERNQGSASDQIDFSVVDVRDYLRHELPDRFDSRLLFAGAEVDEVAFSLATNALSNKMTLGLNLKAVRIDTIEFSQLVDQIEFGSYRLAQNRKRHDRFNFDLGGKYRLNQNYSLGLVVRNIIAYSLATVSGQQVKQRAIARGGLGYRSHRFNAAVELDLTRNEPLGFDPDKRYLAFGIEWLPFKQTALRAGYRHNTVDGSGLPSLGLGIGFQQGHLDIGIAKSDSEDEWALGIQLGLQF